MPPPAGRDGVPSTVKGTRFLRYFFPLEADRQKAFMSHLVDIRPSRPGSAASPLNGEQKVKLPMYGHYDVVCPWDPEDPALDTEAYSPQLGYVRLQTAKINHLTDLSPLETSSKLDPRPVSARKVTSNDPTFFVTASGSPIKQRPQSAAIGRRALGSDVTPGSPARKPRPQTGRPLTRGRGEEGVVAPSNVGEAVCSNMSKPIPAGDSVVTDSPAWKKYTSAEFKQVADIQELATWVLKLHPRSVHDIKPVMILVQGLLKDILLGKMKLFSAELAELKLVISKMQKEYSGALSDLQSQLAAQEAKDAEARAKVPREEGAAPPPPSPYVLQYKELLEGAEAVFSRLRDEHDLDQAQATVEDMLSRRSALDISQGEYMKQTEAENVRMKDLCAAKDKRIGQLHDLLEEMENKNQALTTDVEQKAARIAELEAHLAAALERERKLMSPKYNTNRDVTFASERYGELVKGFSDVEIRTWGSLNGHVCLALALYNVSTEKGLAMVEALDPVSAAYVLELTHPTVAVKVVRELIHSPKVRSIVPLIGQDHFGAICAELSDQEMARLSQIYPPSNAITRAKNAWGRVKDNLGDQFPTKAQKDTANRALGDMSAKVSMFWLNTLHAGTASDLLDAMPIATKSAVTQELALYNVACSRATGSIGKEDDNLQRRGQELASIRTMEELQEVGLELAKDIQTQYGVSITLSVVDPPIEQVEEDFRPEKPLEEEADDNVPEPKDDKEGEPEREEADGDVALQIVLGKMDQTQMRGLSVLFTTETLTPPPPKLVVDKVPLAEHQKKALEFGEVVRTREVVVTPVLNDGKLFGMVTARACTCEACGSKAGGVTGLVLEQPNVGKVLESIAEGIKRASENVTSLEEAELKKVELNLERGDLNNAFPSTLTPRERQKYSRLFLRAAMKQAMTIDQQTVLKELREVKLLMRPPPQVTKVLMGAFQLMKQEGLSKVVSLPVRALDMDSGLAVWGFLKRCMEMDAAHPQYLVRRLQTGVHERLLGDPTPAARERVAATMELLSGLTHAEVKQHSAVLGRLRKWMLGLVWYHTLVDRNSPACLRRKARNEASVKRMQAEADAYLAENKVSFKERSWDVEAVEANAGALRGLAAILHKDPDLTIELDGVQAVPSTGVDLDFEDPVSKNTFNTDFPQELFPEGPTFHAVARANAVKKALQSGLPGGFEPVRNPIVCKPGRIISGTMALNVYVKP